MLQVRHGVFETNSSSTHSVSVSLKHSIIMCNKSDYEAWKNGESYLSGGKILTKEDVVNTYLEKNKTFFEQWLKNNNIITFDNYKEKNNLYCHDSKEEFVEEFETSNGDTVVCFGYCYADGYCEEDWG